MRLTKTLDWENRKYLDNIAEGLLFIDKDHRIGGLYSASLVRLFGRKEIAGMSFPDFVLPEAASDEERSELTGFLDILFHNTLTEMDMIAAVNPLKEKRLRVPRPDGETREIFFNASFIRMFKSDRVESLMVIFDDRTEIVQLRKELEAERRKDESRNEYGPGGSDFFESLKVMANGIARDLEKEAVLIVRHDAGDIPYLPAIKTPLIHLIRNALDHGIELPIKRLEAGKAAAGRIRLTTRKEEDGAYVVVLTDDGRGIDFAAVEKKALEKGLIKQDSEQDANPVSKSRLVNFLFRPEFSGEGAGLSLVFRAVTEAGGRISVESGKNVGTKITLRLPPADN